MQCLLLIQRREKKGRRGERWGEGNYC
jgi:hypothetical protein